MKFKVRRYWQLCDCVEVESDTADQAVEIALQMPLDESKGDYVMGSLDSDANADVEPIVEKGTS